MFNSNNDYVVMTTFSSTVYGSWVSLLYDSDPSTIYYEASSVHLIVDPPIMYCIDSFDDQSKGYRYASIVIVALYWMVFALCVLLSFKIYAVELMFALQFAYMSLIPVGVYCPPFSSLNFIQYSVGWNGINFGVAQTPVSIKYVAL